MDPRNYRQNLARLRSGGFATGDAAATATGQAYLQGELSILDPTLRIPYPNSTWRRDVPVVRGGGWKDNEVIRYAEFRAPKDEVPGTNSNDIRTVHFNRTQEIFPIMPWEVRLQVGLIEGLKLAEMGDSIQPLYDQGVRLAYETDLNKRVYQGINGFYGLTNNPNITSFAFPQVGTLNGVTAGTAASALWINKMPAQILADFNFMATTIATAQGSTPQSIPDRFLVPWNLYSALTQMMTIGGVGGGESIAGYVMRNYFGVGFGVTPMISPLPYWLDTAGVGGTTQIVAYKYDPDCLNIRLAVDIQPFGGPLSVVSGNYESLYVANIGVVKVLRSTIAYFYGA